MAVSVAEQSRGFCCCCFVSIGAESEALLHKLHSQYVREAFEPRTYGARLICYLFYSLHTQGLLPHRQGSTCSQLPLQSSSSGVVRSILAELLGHALLLHPLAPSLARDVLRALGAAARGEKCL